MGRRYLLLCMLFVVAGLTLSAIGQERASTAVSSTAAVSTPVLGTAAAPAATQNATTRAAAPNAAEERALRLEGEKRFRSNCGRCHQVPHKFPPRVMASAIRHMRVRATITDEDMRLILRYMTR